MAEIPGQSGSLLHFSKAPPIQLFVGPVTTVIVWKLDRCSAVATQSSSSPSGSHVITGTPEYIKYFWRCNTARGNNDGFLMIVVCRSSDATTSAVDAYTRNPSHDKWFLENIPPYA